MSIVTYENVDTPVFELDTMRYLFRDGLQGMWIDFLPDYAFADTDLTTPANPGEGIAGYVDRGPYGYDGTQPVITARPIFRVGPPRAEYDGADDVLPSSLTIPSISEGCFILVGTAGIWIDNEYSNTTGTLSVGPTTYTGGPAGILPVAGDVLSIIVRDEPLTDQERQKVIQAGVKRGSAGLIELGPELIVNGDFSDGATGWTLHSSASVIDGGLAFDGSTVVTIGTILAQASGSPLNDTGEHLVSFQIVEDTLFPVSLRFGGDAGSPLSAPGVYRRIVDASPEKVNVRARVSEGVRAGSIDNISIRRLIMPGETP